MYGLLLTKLYIYIYITLNQSLEKIQLESKLKFSFVSFPYKLNCLYFCCYFFFELMNIYIFYTISIHIFFIQKY